MNTLTTIQTRAPLAYPLLALITGLIAAKQFNLSPGLILFISLLLACALVVQVGKQIWYPCFLLTAVMAFCAYGELRLPTKPQAYQLGFPARETTLQLKIERVLQERSQYNTASCIARVISAPWQSRLRTKDSIYCRIELPEDPESSLLRGQVIEVTGVLTPLPEAESEERNFESYLRAIAVHYRFDRTSQLTELQPPEPFDRFCQTMNLRFQHWLQLGSPEGNDLSKVYSAMLLGRKAELSNEQSERFRMTGTMHFFAISGLHIGVIATVIAQALRLVRVPRWLSPFIGLPLVYCYVEITGAAPSAVRAFLMASFFWASFAFQRQRSPFAALIGSAFFVLLLAPQQLWSVGFQLSYAVVLSILLFGLPLNAYLVEGFQPFRWLPPESWTWRQRCIDQAIKALCLLFAISASAWLASAPLSATYFGFIAPTAILLNILLVNLASLVICGGVIALGCGLLQLPILTAFLNHSAWVCIFLMDTLVICFTKIPGAILTCDSFRPWIAYGILSVYFAGLLSYHYYLKRSSSHWLWLAPALLITLLAAGALSS